MCIVTKIMTQNLFLYFIIINYRYRFRVFISYCLTWSATEGVFINYIYINEIQINKKYWQTTQKSCMINIRGSRCTSITLNYLCGWQRINTIYSMSLNITRKIKLLLLHFIKFLLFRILKNIIKNILIVGLQK